MGTGQTKEIKFSNSTVSEISKNKGKALEECHELQTIGKQLLNQKIYIEAIHYLEKALYIKEQLSGPENLLDVGDLISEIGRAHLLLGFYDTAFKYFQNAKKIYSYYPHLSEKICANDLDFGYCYYHMKQLGDSEKYFQSALKVIEKEEPILANSLRLKSLDGLSLIYRETFQSEKAIRVLNESLELLMGQSEKQSEKIVDHFTAIGVLFSDRQAHQQASFNFKCGLRILVKEGIKDHPKLMKLNSYLGFSYEHSKLPRKALKAYMKAISLSYKEDGLIKRDKQIYQYLSNFLFKYGDHTESLRNIKKMNIIQMQNLKTPEEFRYAKQRTARVEIKLKLNSFREDSVRFEF